jgi:hypothetical protein
MMVSQLAARDMNRRKCCGEVCCPFVRFDRALPDPKPAYKKCHPIAFDFADEPPLCDPLQEARRPCQV